MSRRRKLLLTIAFVAIAIATAAIWALPEVVRRIAVDQIPKATGRPTSIGDVDLNLFTGSFALKNVRVAERQGPEAFLEIERIEGRLSLPWLAALDVRFRRLAIAAPVLRVVRAAPAEFNFSDLLALIPPPDPEQKPSRWSITVDRLELSGGRVIALDRAVSPAGDWSIADLAADASGVSTRASRPPGRADLRARFGPATLRVESPALRLAPVDVRQKVTLAGLDLARIRPYVPPESPALPEGGILAGALEIDWKDAASGGPRQTVTGELTAEGLALVQRGEPKPFARVGRAALRIKQADLLARDVVLAGIDVDAPELRVVRRPDGKIDLLSDVAGDAGEGGHVSPAAAREPAPAPVAPAATDRPWRVLFERFALERGTAVYVDQTLSPAREYTLGGLTVGVSGLSTSAADPPGRLAVKADVTVEPGGSRPFAVAVDADALRLEPLLASGDVSVSDLELGVLSPLLAEDFAVVPARGRLDLGLRLVAEESAEHTKHALVSGTLRLTDVALVERAKREPFAAASTLAVAIREGNLLTQILDLESVELDGVTVRAVRDEQGRVDLLALSPPGRAEPAPVPAARRAPAASPAAPRRPLNEAIIAATSRPWQLNVERLVVRNGSAGFQDRGVAPAQQWHLRALTVDGHGLSTAAQSGPGKLRLRGQLANGAGGRRGSAALAVDARSLRLAPLASSARVSLTDFALAWAAPYVPASVSARPADGLLGIELDTSVAQGGGGLAQAVASGTVRLAGVAVTQGDGAEPFLKLPGAALAITRVDALRQAVHLASVELDGIDVRAVRHPDGKIDLLALGGHGERAPPNPAAASGAVSPAAIAPPSPPPPAPGAGPASGGPSAPGGAWTLRLDRLDLRQGTATFEDRFVRPPTTVTGTDVAFAIERLTWPATGPVVWTGSLAMPGGGRTDIEGHGLLDPVNIQIKLSTRDAPIAPYDAYFPFAARFRGLFNGDSVNEIEQSSGVWRVASRGTAWGQEVEVWGPGRDEPDMRMEQMEFRGIDFSWPNYAIVDRVTFDRPHVQIERDQEGVFNLRRLFEVGADGPPPEGDAARGPGAPAGGERGPASPALDNPPTVAAPAGVETASPGADVEDAALQTIVLDFKELAIEGGYIRFLDRTTTPTFSQEMSDLELRIRDLSNVLGRQRTTLTVTAVVGADAGLDLRGELSGIGETLRADLVGDLRDYPLSTASPYAERATAWIVERGKLAAKVHYRVEGDVVTAEHDVKFGGPQVRRSEGSDEVKNRVGLPLGLIVGLLKDTRGDIDFNLPLKGSIKDRAVDWTDAVWSGVKQAVLKLLAGPFRAIGRAFRGGGEDAPDLPDTPDVHIDPLIFAAGSAVIAPEMEKHLTRVADFLRQSPQVGMTLRPVVTEADLESVKLQSLTARIQAVQDERRLKEFAAAVTAYYKAQNLPAGEAKTPDEQLAVLQKREPVDEPRVQALLERRLAAAREALVKTEGIAAERLAAGEPARESDRAAQGRVEFAIGGAE